MTATPTKPGTVSNRSVAAVALAYLAAAVLVAVALDVVDAADWAYPVSALLLVVPLLDTGLRSEWVRR